MPRWHDLRNSSNRQIKRLGDATSMNCKRRTVGRLDSQQDAFRVGCPKIEMQEDIECR